jgi:hypothetical protein
MKTRVLYAAIGLLAILLLGSASLIAWGYWQIYGIGGWRDQLYASEAAVASRRALDDFRGGQLRLYILGGENEAAKYTGTKDGAFEVCSDLAAREEDVQLCNQVATEAAMMFDRMEEEDAQRQQG